ncbi:hypothetical protein [Wielerella bovis]|uniref:hypothetical protein n=1 Tax=Wielerella bovis TaxID=2917790 RepID=UPI002019BCF5|nr:hypothetical protein [Wielerella bovis]ULJ67883.1 hypothetical protein MIS31_04905 [Wielerella bovis]
MTNPTDKQKQQFHQLYAVEKKPLRAAAAECGLDIISATILAKQSGCLRFTEAVIVNSKAGEQGRIGEELFQQQMPHAINCNTSIRYANPHYDFLLDGLKIDIKCSAGFIKKGHGEKRIFPLKIANALKTDLFICYVKSEAHTPNEPESYCHAFIIPSLFLIQSGSKLEIREQAIVSPKYSYHEHCYPIEEVPQIVQQIANNRQAFAITDEMRELAHNHKQLKKETNRAKRQNHNRTTA